MSVGGVIGRILNVDLERKTVQIERIPDEVYIKFLGGYGFGAYLLYQRQRAGIDALGPENIFGLATGPLTGTPAITGNRFAAFGKSPKTNTWGDANCGGNFGPGLKAAGCDAVLFSGIAQKPVYLLIANGKPSICDAADLWGLDSNETEDRLIARHGHDARVACIGPAGERRSLLACIINDKGRAAGRSGLGAVMGSKKLKAVVAVGNEKVPVADPGKVEQVRQRCFETFKTNPLYALFHKYGTAGITANSCKVGDTPIKNWKGIPADFPTPERISDDAVNALLEKPYGCWHCPIACGGHVRVRSGPFASAGHKPEYETLGVFGTLCLNDSVESIVKVNDICNRAGIDTIGTGATVAFAIECYEHGLLKKSDTDGLELTWGNPEAIVKLTELIARDEGIGRLFSNGMKAAALKLGEAHCEEFAMHIHGEELPMHDPRLNPSLATNYQIEATPARHTQMSAWFDEALFCPPGLDKYYPKVTDKYTYTGKAQANKFLACYGHVMNAAGMCMFGAVCCHAEALPDFLAGVMGVDFSMDRVVETGWRIGTIRMAFTIREGNAPAKDHIPGRMVGQSVLRGGPHKGVFVDYRTQAREYLEIMGWDTETGAPLPETIRRLGLQDVVKG